MHISKKSIVSLFLCFSFMLAMFTFLAPVKADASNLIITLDPGHGGHDPGATGARTWGGDDEKNYNLRQAFAAKERLEEYGVTVHMTRTDDTFVVLEERPYAASRDGSDAFISIHNNSYTSSSARGCVVFIPNKYGRPIYDKSLGIANKIMSRLMNDVGIPKNTNPYSVNESTGMTYNGSYASYNCGSGPCDQYKVIRWSKIYGNINAAMIVESCFQSNKSDVQSFLLNPAKVIQTGEAIADGIADYYGLKLKTYHSCIDLSATESKSGNDLLVADKTFAKGIDGAMSISGWSVHSEGISKFEYSINGGSWQSLKASFRQDVANAMPTYTNCKDINAFSAELAIPSLPSGKYPIKVRGCTKSGNYYDIAQYNVIVYPSAGSTYMRTEKDRFALNEPIKIVAKGDAPGAWVGLFAESDIPGNVSSYYWFEMHNGEVTINDLIKDGTKNDRPELTPGTYKLVTFVDSGYLQDPNAPAKKITLLDKIEKNYDSPKGDTTVSKGEDVYLQGWALHPEAISDFRLYIDGTEAKSLKGMQRQDVLNAYPHYATICANLHGFGDNVSTSNLTLGKHAFEVKAITSKGEAFTVCTFNVTVEAPPYDGVITPIVPSVTIDKTGTTKTVKGIDNGLDAATIEAMFDGDCRITKADGTAVDGYVGSGYVIKLYHDGIPYDTAIIIVKADIDGDGLVSGKDLLRAKKLSLNMSADGYTEAGDVNADGVINDADLDLIASAALKY